MGRTSNSLQHELIKNVLPQIENNRTGTSYKKHIKDFAAWAKESGYRKPEQITRDVIQEYEKHLEDSPKQYSASTIHTYLAPVCKAAGVGMEEIRKPKRTAGRITRGRDCDATGAKIEKNQQGRRQEHLQKKCASGDAAEGSRHQTRRIKKTRRRGPDTERKQLVRPREARQGRKTANAVYPSQGRAGCERDF